MTDEPAVSPFTLGRLPRIDFGRGAITRIPDVVARHGTRVLIVRGGRSLEASGHLASLRAGLAERGVAVAGEALVVGEPSPGMVDGAVATHRGSDVEVVLGVGGGSVLDAAKAIAGLLRTTTSVRDHLEGVGPQLPYPGPAVPLVAVPTTAGTGSEATRNAVVSERGPGGFKRSFRDERLVAAEAIVDPDLLRGAGPVAIATNGMDALTQLLESYVSLRAGPMTDALALSGLAAVRDGLLAWHADPDGEPSAGARSGMAYGALLSGICLAHAGLGASHGLASPLGAQFPVPHGAACGATVAGVCAANISALEAGADEPDRGRALDRFARLGRVLAELPEGVPSPEARAALVETLRTWTVMLGIPRLSAFGMTRDDIDAVVADARGSSMRTNPVILGDDQLAMVLREAL